MVEPKAAFAGMTLEASFARSTASMAAFSEERTRSCPFGRCDLSVIGKTKGSCEGAVRRAGREEESEP